MAYTRRLRAYYLREKNPERDQTTTEIYKFRVLEYSIHDV